MNWFRGLCWAGLALPIAGCAPVSSPPAKLPEPVPVQRSQNPSPMLETARRHERIPPGQPPGISFRIDSIFSKPIDVFIPAQLAAETSSANATLLVHLFGAAYIPMQAVANARGKYVAAVVNLGGGSSSYEQPLSDSTRWQALMQAISGQTAVRTGGRIKLTHVVVSAFSAGYGGVRALLSNDRIAESIDGVILLDGLHTSYIPERTVLSEGGMLDTAKLVPFARFARRAAAGEKRMLVTHSEIFPGTFASTTETTDWVIKSLGFSRTPVLQWGPGGMQQISETKTGGLDILGFAGNTGPDHIDHLHGLPGFLVKLDSLPTLR